MFGLVGNKRQLRSLAAGSLGSLVLAFSGMYFIGKLSGLVGTDNLYESPQIALKTTALFFVLGVALLAVAWRNDGAQPLANRRWIPAAMAIACLTVTVMMTQAMRSNERRDARAAASAVAALVSGQIRVHIDAWQKAFARMAQRLDAAATPRQREWESDASNYVRDNPGLVALERLDNASVVRWVVPLEGNERLIGTDLNLASSARRALSEALESHETRVSAAVNLVQGGTGFMMFCPIGRADRGKGTLSVVFRVYDLLKSVSIEQIANGYQVEILNGTQLLFSSPIVKRSTESVAAESAVILPGTVWTVRVLPQTGGPVGRWSPFIAAFILSGLVVSLLLPLSVAFAQAASLRARESELVEHRLQTEIQEREKSKESVRENEERFRLAFGNAPIGMALVTTSGRWLRVNRSLCRILGYSEMELLATDFQSLTHPGDLEIDLIEFRRVMAGEIESYSLDKRYFHKSGRIVDASLHVSIVRERPGRDGYFISQIQDISERVEMDRMKSEFISTVSHELRTPLTSIAGSLGLLAGGVAGSLPEMASRLVGIAERNSDRLVRLINDILDIEKAAAGKLEFELQSQPLEPIVRQAIEANQVYAAGLGVNVVLHAVEGAPAVRVDRDRLTQVLTNLISNAAKFSPQGEVVSLGIHRENDSVKVSVRDRGPGIAPSFQSRIFHQFAQDESADARIKGGTGLGLSIARSLTERLGGQIAFETAAGLGTTFFITLPLCPTSN